MTRTSQFVTLYGVDLSQFPVISDRLITPGASYPLTLDSLIDGDQLAAIPPHCSVRGLFIQHTAAGVLVDTPRGNRVIRRGSIAVCGLPDVVL